MSDADIIETVARAIDPEAWGWQRPDRNHAELFNRRRTQSSQTARLVLEAIRRSCSETMMEAFMAEFAAQGVVMDEGVSEPIYPGRLWTVMVDAALTGEARALTHPVQSSSSPQV